MTLVPGHVEELRRSGLSDDTIARAGCYSATAAGVRDLLGIGGGPGLVFPYPELNGSGAYARVKLDAIPPDGKRYRSPKGRPNRLYIPSLINRAVLADAHTPLWITEGEKKALKACQEGLPCIAVPGIWSWKTRDAQYQSVAIQDLAHIAWSGRTVVVVYDSDVATNPKVQLAESALVKELRGRGATVQRVRLPSGSGTEKVGLDDYLLTHSVEALCELDPVDLLDTSDEPRIAGPAEGDLRREGLDLALVWPDGIRFTLSTIRDGRDGVKGQLTVTWHSRRVGWSTWTLSSLHSRREIQKELDEAAPRTTWMPYLKEAAWRFTQAVREGEPVVTLQGQTTAGPEMLLPGWLYAGEPTLLYADGDTGKSLTALTLAVAMHAGVALPGGLVACQSHSGRLPGLGDHLRHDRSTAGPGGVRAGHRAPAHPLQADDPPAGR